MIGRNTVQRWSPRRDILCVLALKAVLLLLLYAVCVAPLQRDTVTPARVAAAFVLAAPPHLRP
jgi:hypothetical protein